MQSGRELRHHRQTNRQEAGQWIPWMSRTEKNEILADLSLTSPIVEVWQDDPGLSEP
jgi:hypothetical protein